MNIYPNGYDGYDASLVQSGLKISSATFRAAYDAISGIQNVLGLFPLNGFPSISERITGVETSISDHEADTANPHSVTALQVGNTTAQWNANVLQGTAMPEMDPQTGEVLTWHVSSGWVPEEPAGGAILSGDFVLRNLSDTQTIQGHFSPSTSGDLNLGSEAARWSGVFADKFNGYKQAISVFGEKPSGTIDGANKEFGVANIPYNGVIQLYDDGLRVVPSGLYDNEGYTVIGTGIFFATAPGASSQIIVDYVYRA